jgi:hypothetical protein
VNPARSDPFAVLGIAPDCDLAEVYAARRRLARLWHPDIGGESQQMAEINDAVVRCVAIVKGRTRPSVSDATSGQSGTSPSASRSARSDVSAQDEGFVDHPSFRIEALPAEAHEALRIVSTWLGEVVVDDPPYLLEVVLNEPGPCWCQFHLLPEAGSSMVGVRVMGIESAPPPSVRQVRDEVIAALNQLDWGDLDANWR